MTGNMIGKLFNDRYKIIDRIGIGGMAEVYRAQDTVLGRIVAVKTMLPQYAADSNFTKRFKQEAAAAANLQSPYIVNVYDWGQDQDNYFIVMEYVRGSDLKTAINERGAINQRKVAEIGSQVCQALSVAHNMDIIHRDIKPQNIMVQPDGNVKVMDFGIARAKNSVMTQTSSVLGTAHYISPEQAQGKDLTPASDIYSLGIVLYEAATGKLPFDGPDAVSVAMKQVNELPIPPSEINPDIDPDFEDIIMHALQKNPIARFTTANDMRHALNDYLAGRSVGFGGAETAILGGAAISDGTAVMPAIASPQTDVATTSYRVGNGDDKKDKKIRNIVIAIVIIMAILIVGGIAIGLTTCSGDSENTVFVPNVTGKTVEVAQQSLEDSGLELGTATTENSETVDEGKIIRQDPGANSRAEKGSKVNVVVSSGKEEVTVPDVTGMNTDQAKKAIESAGLKASAGTAEYSNTVEANLVIRQEPGPNTKAKKGDTVVYILSLGQETGSVPNVTGWSRSEASSALQNAGFKVSEEEEYNSSVAAGNVIRQNPNAGIKAEKGSTVTITISLGKEPTPEPDPEVTVPNVVGWTVEEAQKYLQSEGFKVTVSGSSELSAIVQNQSPGSGASVAKGSTITLTASAPPASPGGGG